MGPGTPVDARRASGGLRTLAVLGLALVASPSRALGLDVQSAFVSLDGEWEEPFATEVCRAAAETLGLVRGFDTPAACARTNSHEGKHALALARSSRDYALHVAVRRVAGGELALTLSAWDLPTWSGASQLVWNIPHGTPDEKLALLGRRLRTSLGSMAAERGVRELVLLRTVASPSRVTLDADGRYFDLASGDRLDFDAAWQIYSRDGHGLPDYLGLALDLGGVLAIGEVWYLTDTSVSDVDWKYDLSWATLRKKLLTGEGLQFDDNVLYLNSPGHPAAGAVFYQSARHRGLGPFGALLTAGAASAFWEYVTEFREVASLNDLIMTPLGGLAFGEPLYQVSDFFRRSEPTALNLFISGLFSFPTSLSPLHGWSAPGGLRLLDDRGLAADQWHRFHLMAGFDLSHADGRVSSGFGGSAQLDAQLLGQPGFGRPGEGATLSSGPLSTRLLLAVTMGGGGLQELALLGESAYAGLWVQQLDGTDSRVHGGMGLVGLGALFEHEERLVPGLTDQLAMVSPVGPTLQGTYSQGGLRLMAGADVYPVFGAMFSEAYPALAVGALAPSGVSPVLAAHGYYWAYGLRGSVRAELEYRDAAFGVEVRRYSVLSAEKLLAQKTGSDLRLADERQLTRLWVSHALPGRGLSVRATFERTRRWSDAADLAVTADDSRVHVQLAWEL